MGEKLMDKNQEAAHNEVKRAEEELENVQLVADHFNEQVGMYKRKMAEAKAEFLKAEAMLRAYLPAQKVHTDRCGELRAKLTEAQKAARNVRKSR